MKTKRGYFAGTSNVVLPVPNKTFFPPEYMDKSRLAYYASLFNSVEINRSFYSLPQARTIAKWADEVPDNFCFSFKLWKAITHQKNLEFDPADVERFMRAIAPAKQKKGCLLVQFPPGLQVNPQQLQHLLMQLALQASGWRIAVEFRSRNWYRDDIYALLAQFNAGMVIHDLPASATPFMDIPVDFVYLRFHGPESGYRGSYTDDVLAEYAGYVREWLDEGKTVYVYFNNTVGAAVRNLATLNNLVL